MVNKVSRILTAFYGSVWCMRSDVLDAMHGVLLRWSRGVRLDDASIQAAVGNAPQAAADRREQARSGPGAVAVIPIIGILSPRSHMVDDVSSGGGTSTERVARQLRQALADDSIGAIVLDIDSPGGNAAGVPELAEEIFAARGRKKVVAVASPMAASGGYWLLAAAEEAVVSPSGEVGSYGVYGVHEDWSKALEDDGVKVTFVSAGKYKVEGNRTEPLGDEARAYMQSQVDKVYAQFTKDLARFRGKSVEDVRKNFGEGRMLLASDALKVGMVDRIDTLDDTIARLARSSHAQRTRGTSNASASARLRLAENG